MSEFILLYRHMFAVAVEIFHTAFCVWMLFGLLFAIKSERIAILWISSALTMLTSQALLWGECPITVISKALDNYGDNTIEIKGGFIAHWLARIVRYHPPEVAITFAVFVFCILAVFVLVVCHTKRRLASDFQF